MNLSDYTEAWVIMIMLVLTLFIFPKDPPEGMPPCS